MNWKDWKWIATLLCIVTLSACSTNVYVRSYDIEEAQGPYKRLRIAVPTAAAGAVEVADISVGYGAATASTTVVDASNILAIVQNEVIRSLQDKGHRIKLVHENADLDLQISFDAPGPTCDLKCLLTLRAMPLYTSVGGAKLIDSASGKIIATYELNTEIRATRAQPPIRIKDWEAFAKKLAAEIGQSLEKLELAHLQSTQSHKL